MLFCGAAAPDQALLGLCYSSVSLRVASFSPLSPCTGTNAATAAPMEEQSLESASCKNGPSVPSTGTAGREPPAWQDLHAGLLRSGIICLPGTAGTASPGHGRERSLDGNTGCWRGCSRGRFQGFAGGQKYSKRKISFQLGKNIKT